jgi:hypothetical protein
LTTRALLTAFAIGCWAVPAHAATLVVGPSGTYTSIQDAIDQASAGDLVQVQAGTYFERLLLKDGVDLLANGQVVVDAENEGAVVAAVHVGSSTSIEGFQFVNGSFEAGGGLFAVSSSPLFRNCTFADCSAVFGGGAYLAQGSLARFENCVFEGNFARLGAGMYLDFSTVQVVGSLISSNTAAVDGAAIAANNASEARFDFTCIFGNRALSGAIIACNYASPRFTNCTISANEDDSGGGTLAFRGSVARVERSIVAFNTGPAMTCAGSTPWVGCTDFFGNASNAICAGDQGTNLSVDPMFCSLEAASFELQGGSPLLGLSCGTMGAHVSTCQAVTAVRELTWTEIKVRFRP